MTFFVIYPATSLNDYSIPNDKYEKFITDHVVYNVPPKFCSKHNEFMSALDSDADVIIALAGGRVIDGNLSRSSLELVNSFSDCDWDTIKKSQKKIVGYSDISYLLCELVNHDIECYYGPNFKTTLMDCNNTELEITLDYLSKALNTQKEYTIDYLLNTEDFGETYSIINTGIATGRLIGGNLDTIKEIILNHGKINRLPNDIIILEEIDPNYFILDNKINGSIIDGLRILKENGVFENIGALILGKSKNPELTNPQIDVYSKHIDNETEVEYIEKILIELNLMNFPIIVNFPCSHNHPMITLPLGRTVTLDTAKGILVHAESIILS